MLQKQDPRSVIGMAQQRRPLLNSFYYPGTAGSRHVESRQSGGGVQISFDFYQRRTNFFRLQFSSGTRLGCPFSRHSAAASGGSARRRDARSPSYGLVAVSHDRLGRRIRLVGRGRRAGRRPVSGGRRPGACTPAPGARASTAGPGFRAFSSRDLATGIRVSASRLVTR